MAHHQGRIKEYYENQRINVGILREIARKDLLECLDKCQGSKLKAIVWDEKLIGPFGLIAEYALLKEHDVVKMFTLRPGALANSDCRNVIFLVRPKLALMDIVADNVLREEEKKGNNRKDFHIFFVPRRSMHCERRLEDLGVHGAFTTIDEYCLELLPVDTDVLSLELDSVYKECHLEDDRTSLFHVARSLMTLQTLFGIIPNVYGKGECAKHVFDLMMRMRREMAGSESQVTPQIDNLVLIDRSVDLLTPLATQLTYEGLLDELFGIHNTTIKLPPEKFAKPSDSGPQEIPTEPKQFILNSQEELFAELRDKNFNAVGQTLSRKAKTLSAQYEKRHGAKTIGEIKKFVTELPHMEAAKKSLGNHTAMAELVKEKTDTETFLESLEIEQEFINGIDTDKINPYIEDCIAKQEPLTRVLRLLCMQSVTNSGLKSKVLDYYRREIIQTYGYHHILTLRNLEKAGLLRPQASKCYSTLRKTLRLTVEDVNEQNPTDIAYVHSGYAPLSVRLVQFLSTTGWRAITDVLSLLPGPTVEEVQQIPIGWRKRRESGSSTQSGSEDQKVTLVYFIGGCTFAEMSALRFLSQQSEGPMEYVIATTKLINGTTFLKSLFEPLKPATTSM